MKRAVCVIFLLLATGTCSWAEEGKKGNEGSTTRITVAGNHVLVPVSLTHGGKTVQATLMLDTGASSTLISRSVAKRLNIDFTRAAPTRFQVVGGGTVQGWHIKMDRVEVGGQSRPGLEVAVVVESGSFPFEGLLGMDFLRNFKYAVDFNNQIINFMP